MSVPEIDVQTLAAECAAVARREGAPALYWFTEPHNKRAQAVYARTGAAVLASGATATAGFAVLVASDVRMLRDFGLVTVVDLAAALAGVLLVLPALLLQLERR